MTDIDQRVRTAYHEAGHAVAAVAWDISLSAVSLRPGRGFHGITLFGAREVGEMGRDERERRLIVTLAGDIGKLFAEPLADPATPEAERTAVESLGQSSPLALDRLMESEVATDIESDDVLAGYAAEVLADHDKWIASALLTYVHRRALRTVELHLHALRALASALYSRAVVDGPEIVSIVSGFRCMCHRGWGPPPATTRKETATESGLSMPPDDMAGEPGRMRADSWPLPDPAIRQGRNT